MGGCVCCWVGQWVGSGQMTNNGINLDLIKIIQLFEDLRFVETPTPMGGWLDGSVGGVRSNH